ncbi:MAG: SDR family oxidoreductase, partial [Myxococcales bacterium]|nr:SDR family oxidoreductase [Myxococcales bacterium]
IVTGASSGIGEATAECLAAEGFAVVAAARSRDPLETLAARIERAGGRALAVPTDVADEAACRALVDRAFEAFGRVDLLVNNAGFSLSAALEQMSRDDLRRTFEVNLFGGLQLTGLLVPLMRAQGGGRVVNISSLASRVPAPLAVAYAATKGALESATDCLRLELAPWNIEMCLVVPGFVKTPVFDKAKEWGEFLRNDPDNPYRQLMFDLEEFAYGQLEHAIEPRAVGEVVALAATAASPRARYYVPFSARMQSGFMRTIPVSLRDRILARVYKMG